MVPSVLDTINYDRCTETFVLQLVQRLILCIPSRSNAVSLSCHLLVPRDNSVRAIHTVCSTLIDTALYIDGWIDGWTDGRTDGRTNGQMEGWIDGLLVLPLEMNTKYVIVQ